MRVDWHWQTQPVSHPNLTLRLTGMIVCSTVTIAVLLNIELMHCQYLQHVFHFAFLFSIYVFVFCFYLSKETKLAQTQVLSRYNLYPWLLEPVDSKPIRVGIIQERVIDHTSSMFIEYGQHKPDALFECYSTNAHFQHLSMGGFLRKEHSVCLNIKTGT